MIIFNYVSNKLRDPTTGMQNFSPNYHPDVCLENGHVRLYNWVKIFSATYKAGDCVIAMSDQDPQLPVPFQIRHILKRGNGPIFECALLKNHGYSERSRSYLISSDDISFDWIEPKSLLDYHAFSLHSCFDPTCRFSHLVLRNRLCFNNFAFYNN